MSNRALLKMMELTGTTRCAVDEEDDDDVPPAPASMA